MLLTLKKSLGDKETFIGYFKGLSKVDEYIIETGHGIVDDLTDSSDVKATFYCISPDGHGTVFVAERI